MQDPAAAEPQGVGGGASQLIWAFAAQEPSHIVKQQNGSIAQIKAQHFGVSQPGVACEAKHEPVASTGQVCADANPLAKAPTAINPQRKFEIEVTVFNIGNIRQKYEIQSRII